MLEMRNEVQEMRARAVFIFPVDGFVFVISCSGVNLISSAASLLNLETRSAGRMFTKRDT